jgi:hypothetical protein
MLRIALAPPYGLVLAQVKYVVESMNVVGSELSEPEC